MTTQPDISTPIILAFSLDFPYYDPESVIGHMPSGIRVNAITSTYTILKEGVKNEGQNICHAQ